MFSEPYDAATWIPYLEIGVEFFRTIAWPIAAIVVTWLFSGEIKRIIPRIVKVGPSGIEIRSIEQPMKSPRELEEEKVSSVALDELSDPIAAEIEAKNLQALERIDADKREKVLLRALTGEQMQKHFAIAYSSIFGSQIQALKELNSRAISRQEAEEMFTNLQNDNPVFKDWDLDQYLRYLFQWQFLEEKNKLYMITVTGRNFLDFLVMNGLSENRLN